MGIFGSSKEAKIAKAGCGIRYDPEQLGDDSGFDFSEAKKLKETILPSDSDDENSPSSYSDDKD